MLLLRIIVFPLALIYGLVIRIRNYLYDAGILSSQAFDTPTICVGNLSLGGTGKTPMVEFLITELQKNHRLAVLSRGYRRKSTGFVLANTNSTVEELGDEPFQIFRKCKNIPLAVDANRRNGIRMLEEGIKPDMILLDDAFQHRKVRPSYSILLTTYDRPYYNDYFIPTGTLRDSRDQAKRAETIIITKCPTSLTEDQQAAIIKKIKPLRNQRVLFSFLEYNGVLMGGNTNIPLKEVIGRKVTLVTGIADAAPLKRYLDQKGIDFEHMRFKDHHAFSASEIKDLGSKEMVITTEKDYVKLQGKVENLFYIAISHAFFGDGKNELLTDLESLTKLGS